MSKWERARLGDVFLSIKNGANIKQGSHMGDGYPITRIETISDGKIDPTKMGYAGINSIDSYQDNVLESGDILMSHINSVKHLGKTALYEKENDETIIHGMNLLRLKPNRQILESKYARYYFDTLVFKRQIPRITKNSVNQSSFNVKALQELTIPLPPLDVQLKIADLLDRADSLIEKRKAQIDRLDLLVKSQFIEMFGDPVTNPRRWEEKTVEQVCSRIMGGGTPARKHPKYFSGNIPWVSPKDMKSLIISDSIEHITEEAVKNSSTKLVPENSVLMVIRSGILKRYLPVAINVVPVTINQDMKAFISNGEITTAFLMYCFKAMEADVLSGVRAVTADNIDFNHFKKRKIIVPSISLQKTFSSFVCSVETHRILLEQSLDKLELNFKSLMQKCFRGEPF